MTKFKFPFFRCPRGAFPLLVAGMAIWPLVARAVTSPIPPPVYAGSVSKKAKAIKKKSLRAKNHKSAYTVSSIGLQSIRTAPPAVNTQTILAQAPSIYANSYGPNGIRSHVTLRGFDSYQISETYDGIPLNDLFNASATNYASVRNGIPLTLSDLGSIQIYRGINNPSVNSLYSLGGTIAYEPRQPSGQFGATVGLGFGNFATSLIEGKVNTGSLDGFRTLIDFTRQQSNGWLQHVTNQNYNFYLATVKRFNDGASKFFTYIISNENSGHTPHTVPVPLIEKYGSSYQWPTSWAYSNQQDHHTMVITGLSTALTSAIELTTKVYYLGNTYSRLSYANPLEIPETNPNQPYFLPNEPESFATFSPPTNYYNPVGLFGSSLNGTKYHLYINNTSSLGFMPTARINLPDNTLTIGGNIVYGTLHSAEYWYGSPEVPQDVLYNDAWNERDQRDFQELFVQDKIRLFHNRLHIEPGVKYTQVDTTDADNAGYFYSFGGTVSNKEHYTSPTLGISYRVLKPWVIYVATGRTFKVPEISAYYGSIGIANSSGQSVIPRVTVQPEYVKDYELGTRYFAHGFSASLNVYREDFQNKFNFYTPLVGQDAGLSIEYNGGTARYQGVELAVRKRWAHWYGFANYSVNHAYYGAFESPLTRTLVPGAPISYIPHHMANLGVGYAEGPFDVDLYGKYTGPQYTSYAVNGLTSNFKMAGYTVFNLTGQYRPDAAWEIQASLYNLLNKNYYDYAFVNTTFNNVPFPQALVGEPRAFFVKVAYTFR